MLLPASDEFGVKNELKDVPWLNGLAP